MQIYRARRRGNKMIVSVYNYWRFRDRRKAIINAFKKIFSRAYGWTEADIIFYENLVKDLENR